MTVREALQQGQQLLDDAGIAAPRLTAEVLLMHAISLEFPCDRAWLYAHSGDELRELWWIHYGRYLRERMRGKPTQYITGRQEFYGREFRITPDVLIPRPETEHLIEAALQRARGLPSGARILDIGTGSGAIAATLALETNALETNAGAKAPCVVATDISQAALAVAAGNALRLKAGVRFAACDLGSAFADASFDLVASNPPYVPSADRQALQREVRDFEPPTALYAGEDGLAVYRRLIPEARRLLKRSGWLIMELGYAGADPVREMLDEWREISVAADLAGIPRVISARRPFEQTP